MNPWEEQEKGERARERAKARQPRRPRAHSDADSHEGKARHATGTPRIGDNAPFSGAARTGKRQPSGEDRESRRTPTRGAFSRKLKRTAPKSTERTVAEHASIAKTTAHRTPAHRTPAHREGAERASAKRPLVKRTSVEREAGSRTVPQRSTQQRSGSLPSATQRPATQGTRRRGESGRKPHSRNPLRPVPSASATSTSDTRSEYGPRTSLTSQRDNRDNSRATRGHARRIDTATIRRTPRREKQGASAVKTPATALPAAETSATKTRARTLNLRGVRILLILGVLLLIAGAASAYFFFTHKGTQATEPQKNSATAIFEPVACTGSNLVMDLSVENAQLGAPVTFTLRMRNTDRTHPCSIDVGSQKLNLVISSGDAELYASTQCKPSPTSKLLLIPADSEATTTLMWNASAQCDRTGTAKAGSYTAEVTHTDEATLKDSLAFTLGK